MRRSKLFILGAITVVVLLASTVAARGSIASGLFGSAQVGVQPNGAVLLPENQQVTPAGTRIRVNEGRLTSSAVRPDGLTAVAAVWNGAGFTVPSVDVFDLRSGTIIQRFPINMDYFGFVSTVGYDGLTYSADGNTLWVSQDFDVLKIAVAPDGTLSNPVVISASSGGNGWIPSRVALSADGRKAYVALNGLNDLGVIDTSTNQFTAEIPVGNAPRQVVLVGDKAYVSNEGGRPAQTGDFTNQSYGTNIVADRSTGGAVTGTVSVVDLKLGREISEIPVGLHPTALFATETAVLAANSYDDSVSVIDTARDQAVQTFSVNPLPGTPLGSAPNAITMSDPSHVLVSLGRDNAIGVFGWERPSKPVAFTGLIPTDWYPVNVEMDAAIGKIVVTSGKGMGALGPLQTVQEGPGVQPATGHQTYAETGSINVVTPPSQDQLGQYTQQVFQNNQWVGLAGRNGSPSPAAQPVAIPVHLGEPSLIEHVFLIVKENRTYDQVFGDLPRGNNASQLTQYGQTVTPNLHDLVTRFPLLDNFYASGTLSADGHQWLTQADVPAYEEQAWGPDFLRAFAYAGGDALVYQKNGFLWNAAQRAGRSVEIWGEYMNNLNGPYNQFGTWTDWYNDSQILEGKKSGTLHVPVGAFQTSSDVPSLNAIAEHDYPNYTTAIPDQYRADIFLRDFDSLVAQGSVPALNILWLPTDHTTGGFSGYPTPQAAVADNDLAVGRIIDAISHSTVWSSSAVFVVEDDAQSGVDHVDGHRTEALVASPYTKRGAVIDTYYTQLNMVRTIEQILGIVPMNQLDLAAQPMFDVFTNRPNFTAYTALPNQVPLDQLNPSASQLQGIRKAWAEWSATALKGGLPEWNGGIAEPDRANAAMLDRDLWYTANDFSKPYPGDSRVLWPNQVPGHEVTNTYDLGG